MRRSLPALTLWLLVPFALLGAEGGCEQPPPPVEASFAERQQDYLRYAADSPGTGGVHTQIARLALDRPIDEAPIREKFEKIDARRDTADFDVVALLRLLHGFGDSPHVSEALRADLERVMLDFKYWIDEPGQDPMVYWSENHQILFATAEYLAGQLWPDRVFSNSGMTGLEHKAKARPRILEWLRNRGRFGYSEWMSNTYYEEDAAPLLALIDYADDAEIREKAAIAMDLLVYDMALNSYQGFFATTHGRAYSGGKRDGGREATATMQRILFGHGVYRGTNEWAGTALATSTYGPPAVLAEIARDDAPGVNRQRNGITVEEGPRYGYGYADFEDGMFFWGMGGYAHARTANLTLDMAEGYGLFSDGSFFESFEFLLDLPEWAVGLAASVAAPIAEGSLLEKVNIYTYRTGDGMLSSALDKMKGNFAFQQHAWQASLGQKAMIFTTHPAPFGDVDLPIGADYWTGSSSMPRVGQHEDVAVILYDPVVATLLGGLLADLFPDMTHAYFPQGEFDEVVQQAGWTFGRKGDGYVALWSANPATFATEGEWAGMDLIAEGARNAWICEIGRRVDDGSFADFVARIVAADVEMDPAALAVRYASPGQGVVEMAWDGPLTVEGAEVPFADHPRYSNRFSEIPWGTNRMEITRGESSLVLNPATGVRTGS